MRFMLIMVILSSTSIHGTWQEGQSYSRCQGVDKGDLVSWQGPPTSSCKSFYMYQPCGDHKCCCKNTKAMCRSLGDALTYLPPLPPTIKILIFENNSLQELTKTTFANVSARNIVTLSLARNNIVNISLNAFSDFENLEVLSLDGNNRIDILQLIQSFERLQSVRLQILHLNDIGVGELPKHMFEGLSQTNLTDLCLESNSLETFSVKQLEPLRKIGFVSLSNNKIRDIVNDGVQSNVLWIDLSNNELVGEISSDWFCLPNGSSVFPRLWHIQLSNNFVNAIGSHSFKCSPRLKYVGLSGNVVKVIHANAFANLLNLEQLQFSHMHRSIQTVSDTAFNNINLGHLNFRENYLIIKPALAGVIFKSSPGIRILDISLNNMKKLSKEQFLQMLAPLQNLENLTACRCQLIVLSDDFLRTFKNLKNLNLDGNSIHTLGAPFRNIYSLEILSLQGNSFNVITEQEVSQSLLNSLQKINLCDNPFDCTCELLWFRSMTDDKTGRFGNISLVGWPYRYECETPIELSKTSLKRYNPTKNLCNNVHISRLILICLSCALVVGIAGSVTAYRYRWYIKYWLYKQRTNHCRPESRPLLASGQHGYDAYVIYHDMDSELVCGQLRQFIEGRFGHRLHIWDRDAPVGKAKLEAMVDGIYSSGRVLAVVSPSSLADSWVRFQVDVALDRAVKMRRELLMLVLLEEVDCRRLSTYWCVLLMRLTSATWCRDPADVRHAVFEQQIARHFCSEVNSHRFV